MSAACSRSSRLSKQPPPSARHARPRGPKPSEPHGSGLQVRICSSSCLSWLRLLKSWSLRQSRGGSFRLAADQGQVLAQFNLGLMYANGMGPQDYVQAHMWLSLAAARGAQEALKNREIVERHMTTAQIADARELARDWKQKPDQ